MGSESRILRWGVWIAPLLLFVPGPLWSSHRLTFVLLGMMVTVAFLPLRPLRYFSWYVGVWAILSLYLRLLFPRIPNPLFQITFVWASAAIILAVLATSDTWIDYWHHTIRVGILIHTVWGLMAWVGFDFSQWFINLYYPTVTHTYQSAWAATGFGNPNFYAGAVAICFPYFLWRKWWWVALIPISLVLIGSRTFGASLATVAACIWIMYRRHVHWKWIIGMMVMGSVAGYVFDGEGIRGILENERIGWWSVAWDGITSSPLTFVFGHGPSTYPSTPPLHNDYLTVWYQFGAVGLGILIWGIVSLWRVAYHVRHQASIVAYCTLMFTSRPMQMPLVSLMFLIIVGMILRAGCPGPREAAGSG